MVKSVERKNALKKCEELASKWGGKVEELGCYGFAFVLEESKLESFIKEEELEVLINEGEDGCVDASKDYEPAGEFGSIFVDRGGFQEEDRLLAGVSYNEL